MKTNFIEVKRVSLLATLWVLPLVLFACGGDDDDPKSNADGGKPTVTGDAGGKDILPKGETAFVSADGVQGEQSAVTNSAKSGAEGQALGADNAAPTLNGGADTAAQRTVEEGDIYKVLENNRILNLNSYRGLQVIDFTDVAKPTIMGRLAVAGSPVELYVVDNKAVVLLNNWTGYYGSRDDVKFDKQEGGLVALVDLSDPAKPTLLDQAYVRGSISTSRLTRAGAQTALYVAANYYENTETSTANGIGVAASTGPSSSHTVVKSFDVSANTVKPVTELDLGGYVQDIQATTEALLVARYDYTKSNTGSRVSIVDITDPAGKMIEGDEVTVAGIVQTKFNMDLYNGVLRIASGSTWSASMTNHVQTYDAKDFANLTALDHCEFSDGQQLYATLFLGNKAFFVTYLRKDPFHAFSIGDDGKCKEQSQFIVTGWNDYFRAVLDETRLIGIGKNDESGGSTMAVSLYDITDLTNANPLLARAEVALDNSWSQANWDDKAFSVLENAVSPEAAGGETGLVLLPFEGYSEKDQRYMAAVQIYTFSANSLTRRGMMDHGTSVTRSFLANDQVCANLSDAELSLFDHTNPNSPKELGRLELAPDYTKILTFGDYAVRLRNTSGYYSWWGERATTRPNSVAEVVSLSANPDSAVAVTQIEVPSSAYLVKSDNYLVSIDTVWSSNTAKPDGSYVESYKTTIDVYDMGDPTSPEKAGTITTDKLQPSYNYGGYYGKGMVAIDCMDCRGGWYGGYGQPNVQVVAGAVVFPQTKQQQKLLGKETICNQYPVSSGGSVSCSKDGTCTRPSDFYSGNITCRSLNGASQTCSGEITLCRSNSDYSVCCLPVDPKSVPLSRNCYTNDRYRYWTSYSLYVLDLAGSAPRLTEPVEFPTADEGVSVLASGQSVYYSYSLPHQVKDDPREHVQYYFVEVDLNTPSKPKLAEPVNVPGALLAVQGDTIYTQDVLWGASTAQSAINKLEIREGLAYRQASYLFADQIVETVKLDGAGHVLVSHQQAYNYSQTCSDTTNSQDYGTRLTILATTDLDKLSQVDVDSWATFKGADDGKALFQVSSGLLVMNVQDASAPYAQAYFPTPGWPQDILFEGDNILIAAGRYGIYKFNANTFNLLPTDQMSSP